MDRKVEKFGPVYRFTKSGNGFPFVAEGRVVESFLADLTIHKIVIERVFDGADGYSEGMRHHVRARDVIEGQRYRFSLPPALRQWNLPKQDIQHEVVVEQIEPTDVEGEYRLTVRTVVPSSDGTPPGRIMTIGSRVPLVPVEDQK